jgi:hypothetical protein
VRHRWFPESVRQRWTPKAKVAIAAVPDSEARWGGSSTEGRAVSGPRVGRASSDPEAPRMRHSRGRRASDNSAPEAGERQHHTAIAERRRHTITHERRWRPPTGEQRRRCMRHEDRVPSTEGAWCARRRSRVTSSDRCSLGARTDDFPLILCPRRRPPATTSSNSCYALNYCVLCLPHSLFMLKTEGFYARTWSSYTSLLDVIFVACTLKSKFLDLCYFEFS